MLNWIDIADWAGHQSGRASLTEQRTRRYLNQRYCQWAVAILPLLAISNCPALSTADTSCLSLISSGTRHEYRRFPGQHDVHNAATQATTRAIFRTDAAFFTITVASFSVHMDYILTVFALATTSNGPALTTGTISTSPFKSRGTRHEYRQVPPHPYSNWPRAIVSPFSLSTSNRGAGAVSPVFWKSRVE